MLKLPGLIVGDDTLNRKVLCGFRFSRGGIFNASGIAKDIKLKLSG